MRLCDTIKKNHWGDTQPESDKGGFKMTTLTLHRYTNPVQLVLIILGMTLITLTACGGTEPLPTPEQPTETATTEEAVSSAPSPEPTHTVTRLSDTSTPLLEDTLPLTIFWQMEPSQWEIPSTRWADIGETNTLCEDDPSQNYGKAESEIITVDVDTYPLLCVNATAVDPGSRYIIQLLDKSNDEATNVLTQAEAGSHIVNLTEDAGWRGEKQFTLNIWIEGESKCTMFENIAIGAN
jgi:hypothetical protein